MSYLEGDYDARSEPIRMTTAMLVNRGLAALASAENLIGGMGAEAAPAARTWVEAAHGWARFAELVESLPPDRQPT